MQSWVACHVEGWSGAAKCEHSCRTWIARTIRAARVRWCLCRSAWLSGVRALSLVNRGLGVRVPPPAPIPLFSNAIQRSTLNCEPVPLNRCTQPTHRRADQRKRRTSRVSPQVTRVRFCPARPGPYRTRIARSLRAMAPCTPVVEDGPHSPSGFHPPKAPGCSTSTPK